MTPTMLPILALFALPAAPEIELPALISDGVVLPRDGEANLWGWATPGATIKIEASWGAAVEVPCGPDGRFDAVLETGAAALGQSLRFSGDGEQQLTDVALGEVWLASGQSNMEMAVGPEYHAGLLDWQAELERAERPDVRLFTVDKRARIAPERDVVGEWSAASADTVVEFSAVAWVFAERLAAELGCTVGVVDATWGGTPAEAWMSAVAVTAHGGFESDMAMVERERAEPGRYAKRLNAALADWVASVDAADAGTAGEWSAAEFESAEWATVDAPGELRGPLFDGVDGVFWLRRRFTLESAGPALLELGAIDDMDRVFVNGGRVGAMEVPGVWNVPREYRVPADLLREGENTVAVRVIDTAGGAGLMGEPDALRLSLDGGGAVPLAGSWRAAVGADALPALPEFERFGPTSATALFNGMIAPLAPFAFDGAIWYQGEANQQRYGQYATLFAGLIEDWRETFGVPELSFLFVQIAPFGYPDDRGEIARLRESQAAALALPATGMAVTLDVGDCADIHPRAKRPVGERLFALALDQVYGIERPEARGPELVAFTQEQGALRLRFEGPPLRLAADAADVGPFAELELAGEDRVFHPARATAAIAFDPAAGVSELVVRADEVPAPVAVRYAFSTCPTAHLFYAAGEEESPAPMALFPLAPFRTDDWPIQPLPLADYLVDAQFTPLFDGTTLGGWVNVNGAADTWEVRDGVLATSGQPVSTLRTERAYKDFVLELEWRHLQPGGNSGVFIWSDPDPMPDSPFPRGLEIQVMDGPDGDWYTTQGDVFPVGPATFEPDNGRGGMRAFPVSRRSQPAPQWNHYRIVAQGGSVQLWINGGWATSGRGADPSTGHIHLEAEGAPIEFRNLRIAEL